MLLRTVSRRRLLATSATALAALTGCLSETPGSDPPTPGSDPPTTAATESPARRTAENATATFTIIGSHAPTEDTARASFTGNKVTVTGSMDPEGCNRPALASIRYDATDGSIKLVIDGESPYGPTATVECGNASFDYRCRISTQTGEPSVVTVIHDYQTHDDQTFRLDRG